VELGSLCPCCSGQLYESCCKPLHEGKQADDPLQLMRSRFSAYALQLPDYIIATTHPASPQYQRDLATWKKNLLIFSQNTQFLQLDVHQTQISSKVAMVFFTAHLSQQGRDGTFTEKSFFEFFRGRWFYRVGHLIEGHAPNVMTVQEFRVLPLAYYGDPVLRKKADPVGVITEEIKQLVDSMIDTMDISDGIGIAAPQVHHAIQLFIIRVPSKHSSREDVIWGDIEVFIDPTLSDLSAELSEEEEACLSIPGIRAKVKRPRQVTVEYTNLAGERICRRVSGWEARVIMHEYDHIHGILFTDRLSIKDKKHVDRLLETIKTHIHGPVFL